MREPRVLVVGVGHPDRGDDAVGIEAARRAAKIVGPSVAVSSAVLPVDLLDHWSGADVVVVVDAVRSGAPPGTVSVVELADGCTAAPPAGGAAAGTHGLGVSWALELSRRLGTAPGRVVLVGVEGCDFATGRGLTPPVAAALPRAAHAVARAVCEAVDPRG